jgi:hypothetical protein
VTPRPASVDRYYQDANVQARMREYCGGATPTAVYVATFEEPGAAPRPSWDAGSRRPSAELDSIWNLGCDVSRSLWDTSSLIFFLELDYQNVDRPDEPFTHPAEVFFKLEFAYQAARRLFQAARMKPFALATGRGYHFVGQIPLGHSLVDALAAVVPQAPDWYSGYVDRRPPGVTAKLTVRQARAATGLGCLLEFASHRILRNTAAESIPVVFNGTVVGNGPVGRECVSIDFSHAGDPLDVRHCRIGFSTYQKHRLRPDIFGWQAAAVPPLASIPRGSWGLERFLVRGRSLTSGQAAAREASGCLPDVTAGVAWLLRRYQSSALGRFHRVFYDERRQEGEQAHPDLADAPPCVSAPLANPNDLLLKPEHIQHVVRMLLARGWRASQIAGLVQARYEADHAWGDRWRLHMDPRTRAEFDVRVFAGLTATGADGLVDFNCVSAQEKNVCPRLDCPHDLRVERDRLLAETEPPPLNLTR